MKIGFVVPSLAQRGPIIFTKNLVDGLAERPALDMEIFYVRKRMGASFPVPCTHLTLRSLGRLLRCDVIHSTSFLPDLIVSLLPISRARKVSSLHNIVEEDMDFTHAWARAKVQAAVWRWALGRMGRRIYSSNHMTRYYRQRLAPAKEALIEYGVPIPPPAPIDDQDRPIFEELRGRGLKIIGDVCLVIRRKGLDQLVRALPALPGCAVVVVGDGEERAALLQQAADLGVADRFRILGFRKDSARYNPHFDVYAMVSRSEGFCMAMLEAMAHGVPVVCSRLPLYAGLIPDEDVAYFAVDDIESLVAGLKGVLADRERYGAAARRLFQGRFTIEAMCAKHAAFYESVRRG